MIQTLRDILSRGGVAVLAVIFAIAFAAFALASSFAQVLVYALQQNVGELETGNPLDFHVGDTSIDFTLVLQGAVTLVLLAAGLFCVWRVTRGVTHLCPECRSDVPAQATVCRYCTADLPGGDK
jgi:large-conductance mechanosensitive channel